MISAAHFPPGVSSKAEGDDVSADAAEFRIALCCFSLLPRSFPDDDFNVVDRPVEISSRHTIAPPWARPGEHLWPRICAWSRRTPCRSRAGCRARPPIEHRDLDGLRPQRAKLPSKTVEQLVGSTVIGLAGIAVAAGDRAEQTKNRKSFGFNARAMVNALNALVSTTRSQLSASLSTILLSSISPAPWMTPSSRP